MENNEHTFQDSQKVGVGNTAFGIGQIALGILVIILAALTAWLTVWALGLFLVIWGGLVLLQSVSQRKRRFFWWYLSTSLLALATGFLLLFFPGMGAAALSLILAILFIMGGLYKILAAIGEKAQNWGWIVFGGGISIILGFFILSQWPINNFLILGVLVGIEIILNGWSLMVVGYASQRIIAHNRQTPSRAHG